MSQNPVDVSREVYNVLRWGDGYFDINAEGHVVVCRVNRRVLGADFFPIGIQFLGHEQRERCEGALAHL